MDPANRSGGMLDAGGSITNPDATDDAGAYGDGINTTGMSAGTGAATGLPCDVQQLFENRCIGCHLGASPPRCSSCKGSP